MTPKLFTAVGIAGILLGCSSSPKYGAASTQPQAHSFGIYMVAEKPDRLWTESTLGDLATIKLARAPVISDADIVSYSFTNHTIRLYPFALPRLPHPPVWHTPFVVVADKQRIYVGAFCTMLSSSSSSVPSIVVDDWRPRLGTNELVIYREYPPIYFTPGPDPRPDERIRQALAGLGKLQ
jgi:hypothetical protein